MANEPKEDEEEENAAGNRKQPARTPVGGSHSWGNENVPTSAPSTLGITGGAAGRFTTQATTLPAEGIYTQCRNKSTGTTQVYDGRKPDATESSRGRKRNWGRYSNNGRTDSRASARYVEGE